MLAVFFSVNMKNNKGICSPGHFFLFSDSVKMFLSVRGLLFPPPAVSEATEKNVFNSNFIVVVLLFYVHGKHLRSCRDGQLT